MEKEFKLKQLNTWIKLIIIFQLKLCEINNVLSISFQRNEHPLLHLYTSINYKQITLIALFQAYLIFYELETLLLKKPTSK